MVPRLVVQDLRLCVDVVAGVVDVLTPLRRRRPHLQRGGDRWWEPQDAVESGAARRNLVGVVRHLEDDLHVVGLTVPVDPSERNTSQFKVCQCKLMYDI